MIFHKPEDHKYGRIPDAHRRFTEEPETLSCRFMRGGWPHGTRFSLHYSASSTSVEAGHYIIFGGVENLGAPVRIYSIPLPFSRHTALYHMLPFPSCVHLAYIDPT